MKLICFLCIFFLNAIQTLNSSHRLLPNQSEAINTNDCFWHKSFPTVGLTLNKAVFNNDYQFLPHRFLLGELAPSQGKSITIGIIDTPFNNSSIITHSTLITHLIKEIAPQAQIQIFSAFNQQGQGSIESQIKALFSVLQSNIHLINMSFKIADFVDTKSGAFELFEYMIQLIPYSIAASGNDGDPHSLHYPGEGIEAYPARIETVTFDVGAFEWNVDYKCPIARFSQYSLKKQLCVGPKSVAPGVYSIMYNPNKKPIDAQGTSFASAFISGCIALVLSEFNDAQNFSREQILHVCYASHIKLHNTPEWTTKTVLGTLDVRTALFTLHVLQELKKNNNLWSLYTFETWCTALQTLLFDMASPTTSSSKKDLSLKNNFMEFYINNREISKKEKLLNDAHYNDLKTAILWCTHILMYAADYTSIKPTKISVNLIKKLQKIFKEPACTHKSFGIKTLNSHAIKNTSRPVQPLSKRAIRYLGKTDSERLQNLEIPYKVYWRNQSQMLKSR